MRHECFSVVYLIVQKSTLMKIVVCICNSCLLDLTGNEKHVIVQSDINMQEIQYSTQSGEHRQIQYT